MDEGEEVAGGFVVASRDPSAWLEPREQSLDVISLAIQLPVVRSLNLAVAFGRNHGLASLIVDRLKHLVSIVALVGDHLFRREFLPQRRGLSDLVCLAGCEQKIHRVGESIAGRMNLRAESAAQPPEFLRPVFWGAPAA